MAKRPDIEEWSSQDYATGYRTETHDIDVPDRQSHEPSGLRAQGREYSKNRWTVQVTHGPFEERDEQGSYYKIISNEQFEGTLAKLRPHLRRAVSAEWKGLRG